ncbi:MAG: arylamine N-acetyltransferase [Chitinophagales bacterium]|nr:arylamine N-acetyltransferase [Chitinophagales bacterium]
MNISYYLNRINYTGALAPNLEVLNHLQKQHLLNIPFENLDIHTNTTIKLDTSLIYDKIINRKRGGFCYELNGLFYQLLGKLGFTVRMISARVYDKEKGYGQEYDHLAIMTLIDGEEFLTDVGFGEFVFHPLKFKEGVIQEDERGPFFIDQYESDYYRVNKLKDGESIPQYIFTIKSRSYREFEEMAHYHQTNPASHFTHKRFLGIPTENGRITLVNNKLKIIRGDVIEERIINEDEYDQVLRKYFKF